MCDTDAARQQRTEERIAHLLRTVDELSELAAEQAGRIARLEMRLDTLSARLARDPDDEGGGVILGDERPPHW